MNSASTKFYIPSNSAHAVIQHIYQGVACACSAPRLFTCPACDMWGVMSDMWHDTGHLSRSPYEDDDRRFNWCSAWLPPWKTPGQDEEGSRRGVFANGRFLLLRAFELLKMFAFTIESLLIDKGSSLLWTLSWSENKCLLSQSNYRKRPWTIDNAFDFLNRLLRPLLFDNNKGMILTKLLWANTEFLIHYEINICKLF